MEQEITPPATTPKAAEPVAAPHPTPEPKDAPPPPSVTTEPEPPTEEEATEEETKREGIRSIISTIAILIIAPLIALSLTKFVFQSYEVDGPSMETTLQNQDRLIVYKLPRTIASITGKDYVPKRAEVVIFSRQDSFEFGNNGTRQIIKRVIALPGERVVIKDGIITVYNQEKPEGFQPDKIAPYGKVIGTTSGDVDLTVPEGHVYVCGDNRGQSLDSRSFGPVPLDDIVGRLSLRVYPFNKGQTY